MTFFRECDASYLETGNYTHTNPIALEDVEAAFCFTKRNTNTLLKQSCENGSMFMVKKAIEKGATNWNWGLRGACVLKGWEASENLQTLSLGVAKL